MLTNTEVKNLKIKQKVYYVKDSHGLRLQINPCGSKIWQHRFRIEGKQKIRMAVNILKLHFKKQDSGEMKTNA